MTEISSLTLISEIQSWTQIMYQQTIVLKELRQRSNNKFQINSIDICLTQIQSLHVKFQKTIKQYSNSSNDKNQKYRNQQKNKILNDYSILSQIFNSILQKISAIQSDVNSLIFSVDQQQYRNSKGGVSGFYKQVKNTKENKSFLGNTSSNNNNKHHSQSHSLSNNNISKGKKLKLPNYKPTNNKTALNQFRGKSTSYQNKDVLLNEQSLRLNTCMDLQKIKSMLKELQSEVKYHQHQDIKSQIQQINTQNRKICSDLRIVKDQNRMIQRKLEKLKDQIDLEKKNQVGSINQYNKSRVSYMKSSHNHYTNANQISSSSVQERMDTKNQGARDIDQEIDPNVSDWVRVRI